MPFKPLYVNKYRDLKVKIYQKQVKFLVYTACNVNSTQLYLGNYWKVFVKSGFKIFILQHIQNFWKHFFLFRGFLKIKTTFSYFPGMFENLVSFVKTSCKRKNQKYSWNINFLRMRRKIIDDNSVKPLITNTSKEFINVVFFTFLWWNVANI